MKLQNGKDKEDEVLKFEIKFELDNYEINQLKDFVQLKPRFRVFAFNTRHNRCSNVNVHKN